MGRDMIDDDPTDWSDEEIRDTAALMLDIKRGRDEISVEWD